jgi:hypothetical protein
MNTAMNATTSSRLRVLNASVLVLMTALAACGGSDGGTPAPAPTPAGPTNNLVPGATKLSYTDPTGTGWRLVKDASSTDARLVLDLVGPADSTSRGVGFNLLKGAGLSFSKFPSGAYALDTGVFQLRGTNTNFESYAGTAADPLLFVSAPLKGGDVLSTGLFQKDRTNTPKALTAPLVQVAVTLADVATIDPGKLPVGGHPYSLGVPKARMIPADIGGMDFTLSVDTIAKAKMVDIAVAVGTVTASQ